MSEPPPYSTMNIHQQDITQQPKFTGRYDLYWL